MIIVVHGINLWLLSLFILFETGCCWEVAYTRRVRRRFVTLPLKCEIQDWSSMDG